MKTTWMMGAALALVVSGAAVQAQQRSSSSDESNITVTGCLQPAGGGAVGTSGTAGSHAAGESFMLVHARVGNAPGGGSGVTSVAPPGSGTNESAVRAGNTPPSPAVTGSIDKNGNPTPAGLMYSLKGSNPELPRHVGQEVEISGRLMQPTAGSATTTAGSSSASNGGSAAGAAASMQDLDVKTIRMIASVCAAQ